jgi:hypothetical protein
VVSVFLLRVTDSADMVTGHTMKIAGRKGERLFHFYLVPELFFEA